MHCLWNCHRESIHLDPRGTRHRRVQRCRRISGHHAHPFSPMEGGTGRCAVRHNYSHVVRGKVPQGTVEKRNAREHAQVNMTPSIPTVSIVVTTRNEEANIWNCLQSIALQDFQGVEICVVHNFGYDRAIKITREFTDKIVLWKTERSAQTIFGHTPLPTVEVLGSTSADMIINRSVLLSADNVIHGDKVSAYIDDQMMRASRLAHRRRFESINFLASGNQFARCLAREFFLESSGFHPSVIGIEEWDFGIRVRGLRGISPPGKDEAAGVSKWALQLQRQRLGATQRRSSQVPQNESACPSRHKKGQGPRHATSSTNRLTTPTVRKRFLLGTTVTLEANSNGIERLSWQNSKFIHRLNALRIPTRRLKSQPSAPRRRCL